MPSKESLNKIDTKKNILTDKKHELQSLKDDVE